MCCIYIPDIARWQHLWLPVAISCSYYDTSVQCSVIGPFCRWSGGLELITKLPTWLITFLWQLLPGPENFSVLVLLSYTVHLRLCICYTNPRLTLTITTSVFVFQMSIYSRVTLGSVRSLTRQPFGLTGAGSINSICITVQCTDTIL